MSTERHLSLCLICLSPPGAAVSIEEKVAGSGRPLRDVISELVSARDRHMLQTVCRQCHQLLADFDAATERARALRSTIQSVFDGADRHLVAMLLEPRQSRAVLAAAARHRQTGAEGAETPAAVHIEILQAGEEGKEAAPDLVPVPSPPRTAEDVTFDLLESVTAVQQLSLPAADPGPQAGAPPSTGVEMTATPLTDPVTSVPTTTTTTNITITSSSETVRDDLTDPTGTNSAIPADSTADTAAPAASRYRCSLCGEGFRDKSLLLAHRRRSHARRTRGSGGGSAALECSVCRRQLPSRAALQRHERSHAADGRFDCTTCGRTFQRAATLQAHQRLHDERGLCCPYCPQKYTSRQDLEQHVARHTGARNCACPECGKTYRFRSNLAHHIQTVHRKAELACAVCGKTFNMMKKLRRHRNIVHGRLRYKCTECDSRFCYEGQLRRHMKKAKHASGGKDQSLEAYIETVETDVDGTQMLTLVIDDGTAIGDDDTRETLVLSVGENFDSSLVEASVDGAGGGGRGSDTILEIIGDGDLTADSADQIILQG
ncbi:zinc finger protein Gfi-1b-like isoform X2 [Amphibalanus amphitrite]|nr:zinc finger protein Gfi-1b-like isoform X2 [Amphibalanus amphitrite]XP_043238606.1 zinc finger protein Gfi-1b-like isoform X2 [Amphibalanus amphitrite]